ncbi:MAG TPA: hypothetical protein VJI12_02650, partial [archaeon]|nr:hypothetical protein [archaeon]
MVSVQVQVLGPIESSGCSYHWITVGVIENPKSIDFDFLRQAAADMINCREYKPQINAARLKIISGNDQMKVTFMDL